MSGTMEANRKRNGSEGCEYTSWAIGRLVEELESNAPDLAHSEARYMGASQPGRIVEGKYTCGPFSQAHSPTQYVPRWYPPIWGTANVVFWGCERALPLPHEVETSAMHYAHRVLGAGEVGPHATPRALADPRNGGARYLPRTL
jgi:hypothetical protein